MVGIVTLGGSVRPEFRQVAIPLIGYLFFGLCWIGQTALFESFLPLMQELRADLDSIKSPANRESYLHLLKGIPIALRLDPSPTYNPWKWWRTRAKKRRLTSAFREHTEHLEHRIKALEMKSINLFREMDLRRRFIIAYMIVLFGLITLQILVSRLGSLG
jgi:hypothetical protein